jgi:hypothetical protein
MSRPRVQILYVERCPNQEPARALVERLGEQLGIEPEIELVEVADSDEAVALRFLGSPTIRVEDVDVEPGAAGRRDFALTCRIYRGEGASQQPEESWVRDALIAAAT